MKKLPEGYDKVGCSPPTFKELVIGVLFIATCMVIIHFLGEAADIATEY